MTTASGLFEHVREFLDLSAKLDLTLDEEQSLLSIPLEEWDVWRSLSVPVDAPASPLLQRRLVYALSLMRRMAVAPAP